MLSRSNMYFSKTFITIVFMVEYIAAPKPKINNEAYLGSQPSKAYYFPWLVTIHRESTIGATELIGSGSILTKTFILGSMDTFVRNSSVFKDRPFFQDLQFLVVYSGGIWGAVYLAEFDKAPEWMEKRKVLSVHMWPEPEEALNKKATKELFSYDPDNFPGRRFSRLPKGLNDFKRGPFGFIVSIALIKIAAIKFTDPDTWTWRRNTLPLPLFSQVTSEVREMLLSQILLFEKAPYNRQCFVGGWRVGDWRLIQHKVIYVPLAQCQEQYCDFDSRACEQWPVEGIHGCFQSVAFTGLCWTDQGSALYCKQISSSAIAILTTAPTCGRYGLPGVFTWIHHGMSLLDGLGTYEGIPLNEEAKYTAPPEKDLLPVYR